MSIYRLDSENGATVPRAWYWQAVLHRHAGHFALALGMIALAVALVIR